MKNEVLDENLSMENFFFACKSMIRSLELGFLSMNFPLKSEIISLNCWKVLKKKFGSPPKPQNNLMENTFQGFGVQRQSISMKLIDSNIRSKKSLSFLPGDSDQNESEQKKTSNSKNFGNMTKSSTMLFLTSPKMRNMISPRTFLQQMKERKPLTTWSLLSQ